MNAETPFAVNDPWAWIWSLGYRAIIPIEPNTKRPGVKVGGKWVGLPNWQMFYPSESDIDRFRDMGAGIGIRCEKGQLAIDADTLSEEWSEKIRAAVETRLGALPLRIGQAPKLLMFCRTEPGYKHPSITFDSGEVEVRTSGQFVAWGDHPKTLRPYRWMRLPPPAEDLPYASPGALNALWLELRDLLPGGRFTSSVELGEAPVQESLRGALRDVERAIALIPNDYASRKVYLRMGYALRAALPDQIEEARRLFHGWCERWTDPRGNDPETVDRDFDTFIHERRVGIGWLQSEANLRSGGRLIAQDFHERIKPEGFSAWPYSFPDLSKIPKRRWLYGGHYRRKTVSATVAPSKVGKSSLSIVEALAMASGKPLLGVKPEGVFRVWLWNGEDDLEELELRVAACMKHYGLTREDVGDRLFLNSGIDTPMVMAVAAKVGATIAVPVVDAVIAEIKKNQIDVMIVDPFVTVHKVSENDNNAIDAVAKTWVRIAVVTECSVEIVHHTRKMNGEESTADDARGASAMVAASRSIRALSRMSDADGRKFGLGAAASSLFRITAMSGNMAPAVPPTLREQWFRMTSVAAGNGEGDDLEAMMTGDQVGVVTLFNVKEEARDRMERLGANSADMEADIRKRILAHPQRSDMRSSNWVGHAFAEALGLPIQGDDEPARANRETVKNAIRDWFNRKLLREVSRLDERYKTKTYIEITDCTPIIEARVDLFD